MRLLLDTCTFLWLVLEPARLSAYAGNLIADPANQRFLSTISAWEIGVLYSLGRITLPQPPERFVLAQRRNHRVRVRLMTERAALYVPNLPQLHRDPFDRMLVCQAILNQLTILTPNQRIRQYPVQTAW